MDKQLTVEMCLTSRLVCKFINSNNISKEDILLILKDGTFFIFYYK